MKAKCSHCGKEIEVKDKLYFCKPSHKAMFYQKKTPLFKVEPKKLTKSVIKQPKITKSVTKPEVKKVGKAAKIPDTALFSKSTQLGKR